MSTELKQIPIELLTRGRYQMRREFAQDALAELAASIQQAGLIQPIVVRPLPQTNTDANTKGPRYEIIAGERRWRAAQLAGLSAVPCLVNQFTDKQAAAMTTIENIQREDLNPIEEAEGYQQLINEFDYLHEQVAAIVGKSRSRISNSLRLLKLENNVQALLVNKQLSEGHGKMLAGVASTQQYALAMQCINEQWSVRKLEEMIRKQPVDNTAAIRTGEDPHVARLESMVSEQFGSEVKLDNETGKRSGWLKLRYYDNETLAGLLEKLGIKELD